MPKNMSVAALAYSDIKDTVSEMGYVIWDVEYVREGAEQYLRVTIDKDGGIDINDCEAVHRAVLPMLEKYEWDHLEVSSPGAERTLRKPEHFRAVLGEKVEIRLFAPDDDGRKSYTGTLTDAGEDGIVVEYDGGSTSIPYQKIGKAKTVFDFENI